jgi:PBP1b-binding outer membrane lipoprotein LpoB
MKILNVMLVAIIILSGCTSLGDMKKRTNYAYSGEIQGDHFDLARCMIDTMEADKEWQINSLKYKISVNPNKKKSQVTASGVNLFGSFNAFTLELNKVTPLISRIKLTGVKFESEEALKSLKKCAEK